MFQYESRLRSWRCRRRMQLTWTIWKGFRDAPEAFRSLKSHVSTLRLVLQEVDETVNPKSLSQTQLEGLKAAASNTKAVLEKLQSLIDKYRRLDTKTRVTWDRMKWHAEDADELKRELDSNILALNTILHTFNTSSQARVEELLCQLAKEFAARSTPGLCHLRANSRLAGER